MKQGSWAYLKERLCPLDKWLKDSEQCKCHCCNKEFKFMVRRRHHCRSCGKIFCSSCSNFWINGKYIDSALESQLRLCEYCHKKILELSKDIGRRNYQQNSQATTDKPATNSDDEEEAEDETYAVYNELPPELSLEKEFADRFSLHIEKKIHEVAEYLCNNNDLEAKWASELTCIVLKATSYTKIDTLYSNLLMDITQYVKIKRIQTSQEGVTRAFRGYAATKNVANKHMETVFLNPRVIIVTPSVEMSSLQPESLKFEEIISQEKNYLRRIMDRLLKFNPHIVFVENTINIIALEYLQSKGVTVVSKLKPRVVDNIKRVTRVRRKIEKLIYLNKLLPEQVVGTCRRIYFQRYEHENETKTIMFLEDDESPVASIVLADPDIDRLDCLKKITRRMLKLCRQLLLEKCLIEADTCLLEKCHLEAPGFFHDFLDREFDSVEQFLRKKSISLAKLNFVKCHFSNLADVKQLPLEQYFKQLPYAREWSFREESDLCFEPEYKTRKFYSKDPTNDIPLGCYLVQKVANIDRKCASCGRPKYNHNSVFYYGGCMTRIEVQEQHNFDYNRAIVSALEELGDEKTNNLVLTKEKLQMQLRDKVKSTLSPKEVIACYFECEDCGHRFCESITLKRSYLENSLLFFLYKLSKTVKSYTPPVQEEEKCSHSRRCRVFKYENTLVKFIVQPLKIYHLNEISLLDAKSKTYLEELQKEFLNNSVLSQIRPVYKACESLMDHLNSLSALYLGDLTPKRHTRQVDAFIKLKDLLSRLIQDMEETIKREETKLKLGFDYTIITQECHNIYVYFEYLLKIATQLDAKIRKSSGRREQLSPNLQPQEEAASVVVDPLEVMSSTQSVLPDMNLKYADLLNVANNLPERFKQLRWAIEEPTQFAYVPIFREDPISFIAMALNSKTFASQKESDNREIKVKISMTGQTIPEGPFRKPIEQLMENLKIEMKTKDYREYFYQVTVLHHAEFEQIRNGEGINFKDFLRAILGCASWDNTGGKSGSKFAKSHNDMIVMKFINDKEFEEFRKFASAYIEYVREAKLTRNDSLLAKIFGIFEVNMRGKVHNCVVMQNIFFRLNMKKVVVYDLKGSEANRFAVPKEGKGFTGLDTNFKVDRNSEPLSLPAEIYDRVLATLQNDCNFLGRQQVIDYSLLLIINPEEAQVRMGIIDFMRPYQIFEKIENFYKEMKLSATPTVIPPNLYSERFMQAMKHYFLRISAD